MSYYSFDCYLWIIINIIYQQTSQKKKNSGRRDVTKETNSDILIIVLLKVQFTCNHIWTGNELSNNKHQFFACF